MKLKAVFPVDHEIFMNSFYWGCNIFVGRMWCGDAQLVIAMLQTEFYNAYTETGAESSNRRNRAVAILELSANTSLTTLIIGL